MNTSAALIRTKPESASRLPPELASTIPAAYTSNVLPPNTLSGDALATQPASDWTHTELLAVLVSGSKIPNQAVSDLISRYPRLSALCTATPYELSSIPTLSTEDRNRITAVIELTRRLVSNDTLDDTYVRGPEQAAKLIRARMLGETREHFFCVHLDNRNQIRMMDVVSIGDHSSTLVHPREVFKSAIRAGTVAIVVGHNHPSGDPEPSAEDIAVTRRLSEVGRLIGIPILDHVVVGQQTHVSMKERGYL